jgi:hypothetical protein
MAKVENLEVLIQANADQLKTELQATQKALTKFKKGAEGTSQGFGSSFSAAGIVAGVGIAAVTAAIGAAVKSSTQFAMQAIESENLVGVTFGNMTGDIVEWSNQLEQALGMNAFETRKSAGVFFNIANSLGLTRDNALNLSKGVVMLANDMASFYNIATDDALMKLQSGLTGEIEPLKRLGILVDDNTIKMKAMEMGLGDNTAAMSQATKASLRYLAILDQTKNAQGDMARTINSPANQLRILESRVKGVQIALGAVFIPVLNAILPYIGAFVIMIGRAIEAVSKFFGIVGIQVDIDAWNEYGKSLEGVGAGASGAADGVGKLKKEMAGLAGFDEMNVLTAPAAGGAGGGAGAGGIGGGAAIDIPAPDMSWIDDMTSKTDDAVKKMESLWIQWGDVIKSVFAGIAVGAALMWLGISAPVAILVGVIVAAALYIWQNWDTLVRNLKWIWEQFVRSLGNTVEAIGVGISNLFKGIVNAVVGYIKWVGSVFKAILDLNIWWVNQIGGFWSNLFKFLATGASNVGIALSNIWGAVKTKAGDAIDWIKDKWEGLGGSLGGIGDAMWQAVKKGINKVIDVINKFLKGINDSLGLSGDLKIKTIPKLAKGGVVSSPTIAMVGEAGKEAVMPLENNTGWITELAQKIGERGGASGEPINLTVQIGTKTIAKEIINVVNNESMRSNSLVFNI